jgi:hypothetical protein
MKHDFIFSSNYNGARMMRLGGHNQDSDMIMADIEKFFMCLSECHILKWNIGLNLSFQNCHFNRKCPCLEVKMSH